GLPPVLASPLFVGNLAKSPADIARVPRRSPPAVPQPAPQQPPGELASVHDGRWSFSLSPDGRVSGLDELPEAYRAAVERALVEKRLDGSPRIGGLAGTTRTLI